MTTAVTITGGLGMTVTGKVDMAAGMTGVDTDITKTATVTGFMHRRQAFIHRLQSLESGFFSHRFILIPEGRFTVLMKVVKTYQDIECKTFFEFLSDVFAFESSENKEHVTPPPRRRSKMYRRGYCLVQG